MLLCGRVGAGGARKGRVSRRYIRMKPNISERPIHACGVRCGWESSELLEDGEVAVELSLLRIPTSPGLVGVTGGVLGGASGSTASMLVPSGMTGPGRTLKGFASGVSSRLSRIAFR